MSERKEFDLFVAYASEDQAWASEFVASLRESGIRSWFAAEEILPGEKWQEQLLNALRESTTLVLILSSHSLGRPWMFFELGAAVADNKRIIPVVYEDLDFSQIPIPLRRFQFLRESSPSDAGKRVASLVEKVAGTSAQVAAA